MAGTNVRDRLLDALFDGVFADILRIREAPGDGLTEDGGWWTFADTAPAPDDDIRDYETMVGRDDLWPAFEEVHQASYKASPPMTIFDAFPHLSPEDALNLVCCRELVAQNLRALEARLAGGGGSPAPGGDLGAFLTAWNKATDRNLDRYAARRRKLRYGSRHGLRTKPLPWIGLMALSPFVADVAATDTLSGLVPPLIAGSAVAAFAVQEVISHFRTRETLAALEKSETRYTENALKLSAKVGFDTALHHKHLSGLIDKVSEKISHILAERREWPDSWAWIKTLSRWFAVHAHLRSRIEALRDALRLRQGYHGILHRGHGAWMDYLDVYFNQTDPRKAAASFLPPIPRVVMRTAWWLVLLALAMMGLVLSAAPAMAGDGAPGLPGALSAGLTGLSLLTAWWRLHRLDARKPHGTIFAKQTTDEACRGDLRHNRAAQYDQNVIALVELLAKWTQPDRSFYHPR